VIVHMHALVHRAVLVPPRRMVRNEQLLEVRDRVEPGALVQPAVPVVADGDMADLVAQASRIAVRTPVVGAGESTGSR
jgi:hypothetical protein